MSYCRKEGKDTIIFATEEFLSTPSTVTLKADSPDELDRSNSGAILPNGEINFDCPCLGNLPNGPCGPSFREAFTCWVENKDNEETFADKCYENFIKWEGCLSENRDIYKSSGDSGSDEADVPDLNAALGPDSSNNSEQIPIEDDKASSTQSDTQPRAIAAASVKK